MKFILSILITSVFLQTSAFAYDISSSLAEQMGVDALIDAVPEEFADMLSGYDFFTAEGIEQIAHRILCFFKGVLEKELADIRNPALQTLKIIILCSLLSGIFPDARSEFPILIFGGASITYYSLCGTASYVSQCVTALHQIYDFSTVLLPCLAGASVVAGATVSAGVKYTAAALFMNTLLHVSVNFLLPLIGMYLSSTIGGTLFQQHLLLTVAKWLKWGCVTLLTGSVAVFVAYINIAGLVSSAGDAFTIRVAQTALSNGLPVVGKILSDTASTLVAGATVLRNCIGVYGLLAVVCILLIPFLSVGLRYILFNVISELSELFPNKYFSDLVRGIAGVFGMLLGVLGTGFILIFMTLISFMQLTVG